MADQKVRLMPLSVPCFGACSLVLGAVMMLCQGNITEMGDEGRILQPTHVVSREICGRRATWVIRWY